MIEKINYITAIISSLTLLMGGIVGFIIAILKNRKEIISNLPKNLRKSNYINSEIMMKLENLKEITNADRISIFDFHNGGHYANGRSALKMSCTFQVTKPSIKNNQMTLQNIPLACYSKFLEYLYSSGYVVYENIEQGKNDVPASYNLWKAQKIKSIYNILITNKYNEPIGFIAIEFLKDFTKFDREKINAFIKFKRYMEGELELLVK